MKIAIYSRKSKYTGKGESTENQIQMCQDYILHHIEGVTSKDIEYFSEEGFSGKNTNRPQFQKMLSLVNQNYFDYVVCYKLDRISRNIGDFSSLIQKLEKRNTAFICIKEQFDTSTPMGRAMMYITSVFSQLERETIAERIRDNMLMLAKTGRWLGGTPPLGFCSCKEETAFIEGKKKTLFHLTPIESEIEIIHFLFSEFLRLQSISALEKLLETKPFLTGQKKKFSRYSIRDILQNPVYCTADHYAYDYFSSHHSDISKDKTHFTGKFGLLSYNKRTYSGTTHKRRKKSEWIIAIGTHPGIIPGTDWVLVQSILERKRDTFCLPSHLRNETALLSGLLHCACCGKRMYPKTRNHWNEKGQQSFSYLCQGKINPTFSCHNFNLDGLTADELVFQAALSHLDFSNIIPSLESMQSILSKKKNNFISAKNNLLDKKKQEIDSLLQTISKIQDSQLVHRYFEPKLAILDKEYQQLLEQQKKQQISFDTKLLHLLPENFFLLSPSQKRKLLHLIYEEIQWDGKNLIPKYRHPDFGN